MLKHSHAKLVKIEAMEQLSAELQSFNNDDKTELTNVFYAISKEYEGKPSEFVKKLPDLLGLL